ncbi:hypothetical protein GDO81_023954 [Engystomops pustulosus]|uniref:Uncharacterized protein n=1 Tax=Engystomops pustulosus TaxID=76066 RepID=A0AAV6ZW60_ENGPU|nr:hypothetical protein GDO81_023954 [Engystomops pustulosus]
MYIRAIYAPHTLLWGHGPVRERYSAAPYRSVARIKIGHVISLYVIWRRALYIPIERGTGDLRSSLVLLSTAPMYARHTTVRRAYIV